MTSLSVVPNPSSPSVGQPAMNQTCTYVSSSVSMSKELGDLILEWDLLRFILIVDGLVQPQGASLQYSEVMGQYMLTLPGINLRADTEITLIAWRGDLYRRLSWKLNEWDAH